jgi:NADH dehydrogenase/NADH:ubiquinone oxidoreductase subunit G
MSVKVTINGAAFEAEKGEYILEVARKNRIPIPSLCHHEGLPGLGCCRLCVVEVNEGAGNRVVVSCVYPVSRDCEVFTESEKIQGIRGTILSMLRDKAPQGERLASLCRIYTAPKSARYKAAENEKCVLCGLCVQACASLGTGAISAIGRGIGKKVSTPYDEPSADCVGCGSCAAVCPTGAIACGEENGVRSIWGRSFELLRCAVCGKAYSTREQEKLARESAQTADAPHDICPACRKKKSADVLAGVFGL